MTDEWTCPCGHELNEYGDCLVWDEHGEVHVVSRNSRFCRCHSQQMIEPAND